MRSYWTRPMRRRPSRGIGAGFSLRFISSLRDDAGQFGVAAALICVNPDDLDGKLLMELGHFNRWRCQHTRECGHGLALAMDQERRALAMDPVAPIQEFRLVRMGREAADGVDLGAHGHVLPEHAHLPGTIDDFARECAL